MRQENEVNLEMTTSIMMEINNARSQGLEPAFAYVRVSSDKQEDGNSLADQTILINKYVDKHNLKIVFINKITLYAVSYSLKYGEDSE